MIKISLVFPHKGFFDIAASTFDEHNKFELCYKSYDKKHEFVLEEVIVANSEIINLHLDTDVIISRGITAQLIKRYIDNIPIVEIPVVGNDLMRSLIESKMKYGNKVVGVIGAQNMIFGVEELSEIIGLDIKAFYMKDSAEASSYDLVNLAVKSGCEVIVSGVVTCEYAKSIGINTLVIKTGKESFWQAITEAKRVALISRKEQEKAQMFKTILNYAYEGVIAVNNYRIITVCNTAAQKTLGIDAENAIGKSIDEVLGKDKLQDLFKTDSEYFSEIVQYNNIQLVLNKVNTILKDQKVGDVVTFQDVTGIQKTEQKIRKKIYSRGHHAKYNFNDIVGESSEIKRVLQTVKKFSKVDSNILIVGNTGTGKELFAQSIHNYSMRKKGPFVAINCAAIPESLLESELFGYVEGAFTGAAKGGKPGFFELAHEGTIFLDEIAEISFNLQARLLRVLEEREVMRIGDDRIIPVNIRVISATNKDLQLYVEQGKFREDLYYRLDVLNIYLPPLDQRKEDIPLIAGEFIRTFGLQFGRNVSITDNAKKILQEQNWHGNIRQLRNACERLVVLTEDNIIDETTVKSVLLIPRVEKIQNITEEYEYIQENKCNFYEQQKRFEKEKIIKVLEQTGYDKNEAAKKLGISKTTLWRRMKELNKD